MKGLYLNPGESPPVLVDNTDLEGPMVLFSVRQFHVFRLLALKFLFSKISQWVKDQTNLKDKGPVNASIYFRRSHVTIREKVEENYQH